MIDRDALIDNECTSKSRREAIGQLAFFGSAMAILSGRAAAQNGAGSGSYSNAAVALAGKVAPSSSEVELEKAVKIARAMRAGPREITSEATVAEMDHRGNMTVLRQGSNGWVCTPGNENKVGDPPMCADALALQWFNDILAGRPAPTIKTPGLCYMLCGATQHSNDSVLDKSSPAIPIGPHWMVLWPFDAKHCGLPTTVRDAGAWIMFAGTPYAYLHICGTPWIGNEYTTGTEPRWTMQYVPTKTTPR